MHLRLPLTLKDSAAASDGGSLALQVTDCDGHDHWVTLVQHVFLDGHPRDRIPGRLYWNDELIGVRSMEESALLVSVESSATDCSLRTDQGIAGDGCQADASDKGSRLDGIKASISGCAQEIRAFVLSGRYLEIAEQLREG